MLFFLASWSDKANDQIVQNVVGVSQSVVGNILNLLRIYGTGLALVMLTWMSIAYFTADGRGAPWAAQKQADIKGTQLKNFAIGVAIFIGASNILYYLTEIVTSIVKGTVSS